jgi:hypothetical protein
MICGGVKVLLNGLTLSKFLIPFFMLRIKINMGNHNWTKKWDGKEKEVLLAQEYKDEDPELFIKDIKKYLLDNRYIKINNKPVIGLYEPFQIPQLNKTITIWREKSKNYGIGEIFVLICVNEYEIKEIQNSQLFDAAYDFPPRNSLRITTKMRNIFLYTELLYKNIKISDIIDTKKLPIYRGSMLEWDNTSRTSICTNFDYYSPEQFYMLEKIIVDWTFKNHKKENKFIFINAWNEWGEGSYLEPDERYGYGSINSLSNALFNLSYLKVNNLTNFNNTSIILVQTHIDKEHLIKDIIKFTNNIPVKFDLFISLSYKIAYKEIEYYVQNNTKSINFEIRKFTYEENDVLPFIEQVMNNIQKYRYCCHISTKMPIHIDFGEEWRNYLLNNLLGNSNIISEILTEFENNENLGFIISETFYKVFTNKESNETELYAKKMNVLLGKMFPKVRKFQNYFDLSEWNNMFWVKAKAIQEIFEKNIMKKIKRMNRNTSLLSIFPNFMLN